MEAGVVAEGVEVPSLPWASTIFGISPSRKLRVSFVFQLRQEIVDRKVLQLFVSGIFTEPLIQVLF